MPHVVYYSKLPKDIASRKIILMDPVRAVVIACLLALFAFDLKRDENSLLLLCKGSAKWVVGLAGGWAEGLYILVHLPA
jgi:uracil phosphoribosyltransferase